MTNDFECIIMKVCVLKHSEEGIAKGSRNVLNRIWSIMNISVCIIMVVCIMCIMCVMCLGFVKLGYVWLCFVTFS